MEPDSIGVERALPLSISDGEAHIWYASLAAAPSKLRRYMMCLSEDERARAERYLFDIHRARFTAGRGILRDVLSRYVGVPPQHLRFAYGRQGKPELDVPGGTLLHFNAAHSEEMLLIGITMGRAIGVDIEHIRPMPDMMQLAERFYAPRERDLLLTLPLDEQSDAFFMLWTCKEALLKACGEGISDSLSQVEIQFLEGGNAVLHSGVSVLQPEGWSLRLLDVLPEFAAALAIEGAIPEIRLIRYEDF